MLSVARSTTIASDSYSAVVSCGVRRNVHVCAVVAASSYDAAKSVRKSPFPAKKQRRRRRVVVGWNRRDDYLTIEGEIGIERFAVGHVELLVGRVVTPSHLSRFLDENGSVLGYRGAQQATGVRVLKIGGEVGHRIVLNLEVSQEVVNRGLGR